MQKDYEVNDIVNLDDKEYCIIKKYEDYYVVISTHVPINIFVGMINKTKFEVIKDKNIIKKVLLSD